MRTSGSRLAARWSGRLLLPGPRARRAAARRHAAAGRRGKGRAGPAAAARGLAAQRELHDRGAARPGEEDDRGTRSSSSGGTRATRRSRASRSTSTGTPSATTSRPPPAARAGAPRATREREERSFGWIQVKSVRRRRRPRREVTIQDLTPTLRYLHPDGNADDRTVMEVRTRAAGRARARRCASGSSGTRSCPTAASGRAGWVHDYHFVAQWFPKIGVFWKGALERPPVPPVDGVLLGLRRLRRAAHPAGGLRGGGHGAAASESTDNPDGTRDPPLRPGGRPRLRVDGQPALPRAPGALRRPRLPAGRHPPPAPARARAPRRALPRGHEDRAARPTGRGRRPTPTRRSRWWTRPRARPRAAWSTRRSSPAGPPSSLRPSCRARRASPSTRRATSSGTASWPTTSSRRRGSTRASTPT